MDDDKEDNIGGTLVPRGKPLQTGSRLVGPNVLITRSGVAYEGDSSATYVAVSSVSSPDIQVAIMSVQPAFQALAEPVLYACAHDDQPVGPRIGVKDVPEPTLKALSGYELERRSRKRERIWWIVGIFLASFATWFFT